MDADSAGVEWRDEMQTQDLKYLLQHFEIFIEVSNRVQPTVGPFEELVTTGTGGMDILLIHHASKCQFSSVNVKTR